MPELTQPVTQADHMRGPENAPVTLVEYGDFECPHCGEAFPIIEELLRRLRREDNGIRFVFRDFPLAQSHPHAQAAAEAAEAAAAQGKFWEMHAKLFQNQNALTQKDLHDYAEQIGLDTQRFDREMSRRVYANKVQDDFLSGVRSGVNGTPTFFINGQRYDGPYDVDSLQAAVERAESKV